MGEVGHQGRLHLRYQEFTAKDNKQIGRGAHSKSVQQKFGKGPWGSWNLLNVEGQPGVYHIRHFGNYEQCNFDWGLTVKDGEFAGSDTSSRDTWSLTRLGQPFNPVFQNYVRQADPVAQTSFRFLETGKLIADGKAICLASEVTAVEEHKGRYQGLKLGPQTEGATFEFYGPSNHMRTR